MLSSCAPELGCHAASFLYASIAILICSDHLESLSDSKRMHYMCTESNINPASMRTHDDTGHIQSSMLLEG